MTLQTQETKTKESKHQISSGILKDENSTKDPGKPFNH
jgi:hypothetical protein